MSKPDADVGEFVALLEELGASPDYAFQLGSQAAEKARVAAPQVPVPPDVRDKALTFLRWYVPVLEKVERRERLDPEDRRLFDKVVALYRASKEKS